MIVITGCQGAQDLVENEQIRREGDQQGFKEAVVHIHLMVRQLQDPAQGGGIADGGKEVIVLILLTVRGNFDMNGPDIRQGADAFQNVGGMAENVFDVLGSGPGNAGEGTEGGGIGEVPGFVIFVFYL